MKRYCITDLLSSQRENINKKNAVLFVYNGSESYLNYFANAVRSVACLCDVHIIIIKPKVFNIDLVTKNVKNKLTIINLERVIPKDISGNQQAFQFLKPYALKYIYDNKSKLDVEKMLYLDIDMLFLRNLQQLFDHIEKTPLIVKELGVDIDTYGYENYVNDPSLDYVFRINKKHKIKYPDIHCNTGVLGFDLSRKLDINIINKWAYYTNQVLFRNIAYRVKWWDQGVFNLVLEKLNLFDLVSSNRKFNHTVLPDSYYMQDVSHMDSNIIHFIGDSKPSLRNMLYYKKNLTNIDISLCAHKPENKNKDYQLRHYLNYRNLNTLDYKKSDWSNNSLGESRIFLAENVYDPSKKIWGCLTASFNQKYAPFKVDHLHNYINFEILLSSSNNVYCSSLCTGNKTPHNHDLWHKNFQKHFRKLYPGSDFVQQKILDITGITYEGDVSVPYANQIICNKELFEELSDYTKKVIDKVIDSFGIDFDYPNIPDKRRSLAYVMEEVLMLWWSQKKNIRYHSFCKPSRDWYEKKQYLNT